jgi:hypothetical protein
MSLLILDQPPFYRIKKVAVLLVTVCMFLSSKLQSSALTSDIKTFGYGKQNRRFCRDRENKIGEFK